jgi:hypothetical protein
VPLGEGCRAGALAEVGTVGGRLGDHVHTDDAQ